MKEKIFQQIVSPLWAQAAGAGVEGPFRKAVTRAVQNGRKIFKSIFHKTDKSDIAAEVPRVFTAPQRVNVIKPTFQNRVFDSLFPKVSARTVAAELRRKAAWQGISSSVRQFGNGGRAPLLCFIGVGLATNETFTSSKSQENICADIRELVQKFELKPAPSKTESSNTLQDLVFGSFIEKGCNAAVYEAKYVRRQTEQEDFQPEKPTEAVGDDSKQAVSQGVNIDISEEAESDDITILPMDNDDDDNDYDLINESALHFEFYGDTERKIDNKEGIYLVVDDGGSDIVVLDIDEEDFELLDEENPEIDKPNEGLDDYCLIQDNYGENTHGNVLADMDRDNKPTSVHPNEAGGSYIGLDDKQFDLAVKMMFNYDAESNTLSISQAMKRETIPAQSSPTVGNNALNIIRNEEKVYLPPHPNIVEMKDIFIDNVPDLPDAYNKYPAALPHRLHQHGLGRNMTMFLVMKRYSSTLREYLSTNDIDIKTRILLLAQLLEGVEHLSFYSIAHRDIKSNNILIDQQTQHGQPQLVISDFGCCLADSENGLKIPYISSDQPKGGNPSLMAPEIVRARPSRNGRSVLDYSKSDLWAAGSLAYEIFGLDNPFYGDDGKSLNSGTYRTCDLPPLPENVPSIIQELVYNMLDTDPRKRPSPSAAATVIQIFLWNEGYFNFNKQIKKTDLQSLILMLTLEVISKKLYKSEESLETELKLTLLKRMTERDLNDSYNFFCNNSQN